MGRRLVAPTRLPGTVVASGKKGQRFAVGDESLGFRKGAFAEHAEARSDQLAPIPDGLSPAEADVVPVPASTALRACDATHITYRKTVLVIGACSGVGSYTVRLAIGLGPAVTRRCSTRSSDSSTRSGLATWSTTRPTTSREAAGAGT